MRTETKGDTVKSPSADMDAITIKDHKRLLSEAVAKAQPDISPKDQLGFLTNWLKVDPWSGAQAILTYRKTIEELEADNMCDVCAGTGKPLSNKPCMCGGTGKMSDAARYLRRELTKLQTESEK